MLLKPIKLIVFLTILAVITGTVSQAAAHKNTCQPGKCCCDSDIPAPRMAHPHGANKISQKCDEREPCCHLNASPLAKNALHFAITSNPALFVHVMAVEPGTRPIVQDALTRRQPASNEMAVPSAAPPLYLQFSTILC